MIRKLSPHVLFYMTAFLLITKAFTVTSQDLNRIAQKDYVRINGSLGTNQTLYFSEGIPARRLPYIFLYTGSLNMDFLGITSTLSFVYTNPSFSKNISNPFNSIAYHPKYKWIAAHIGRFSTSYSPYSLNGYLFNGGGVDLTPPKFPLHFSACFGRFQRAIEPDSAWLRDTSHLNPLIVSPGIGPSYLRWGGAVKLLYTRQDLKIGLVAFRAWDDPASLHTLPVNSRMAPQDNSVLSLSLSKNIFRQLTFAGELAYSGLNKNRVAASEQSTALSSILLMQPKIGVAFYKAYNLGLTYNAGIFTLGMKYERIDPEYRTLGTYFFINDIENTTLDFSTQLFKQKLSLNASFGLQRDDLAKRKETSMRRNIGSLNVNYAASQRLNFTGSYSNFRTYSNTRGLAQQIALTSNYNYIDTLYYRQISENINAGASYALSNAEKVKQNLSTNVTYQNSNDVQGEKALASSTFYNGFAGYTIVFVPKDMSVAVNANASRNDFSQYQTTIFGPSLVVNKGFFAKKLRSNAGVTYLQTQGSTSGTIVTLRAGLVYVVLKKHNLNLNLVVLDNHSQTIRTTKYQEYTITFGYSYAFHVFESKKKTI